MYLKDVYNTLRNGVLEIKPDGIDYDSIDDVVDLEGMREVVGRVQWVNELWGTVREIFEIWWRRTRRMVG